MLHIDVISDIVCPWCFIGKRKLERALAERKKVAYKIEWRPFQLNPDMPRDGMPRDAYFNLKFGGRNLTAQTYNTIKKAARQEGLYLNLESIQRQPNTFNTHRLIKSAAVEELQSEIVESLFQRYFFKGDDISRKNILLEVATDAGMNAAMVENIFSSNSDINLIIEEEKIARHIGITGVPCFIINGKYAISGAQEPSVMTNIFDLAIMETKQLDHSFDTVSI